MIQKIICLIAVITVFTACNEKKAELPVADTGVADTAEKVKAVYEMPVKYTEWEIGKPEYIKTALDFYVAWDNKDSAKLISLFADTLNLRLPAEDSEIEIPHNKIKEVLTKNRGLYASTSNNIISAVSLHDRESSEDWVMVTTYSKWVETNGSRDSVLYQDNWKFKDGKINVLTSFFKMPTRQFVKANDPKNKK